MRLPDLLRIHHVIRPYPSILLLLLAGALANADENVRNLQTRLKNEGFYYGEFNGNYDSETSAAVTRYQIRNGLQITGQLDAQTAKALGVSSSQAAVGSATAGDPETWRALRKTDRQFLNSLNSGVPYDAAPVPSADTQKRAAPRRLPPVAKNREQLRDYIAAFVLAGVAPRIGSELEFFAERVDYYGEKNVSWERIRRDLERYAARWPERSFWLTGDPRVEPQAGERVRVTFPLHYELQSPSAKASGEVRKTLLLQSRPGAPQIVSVNEAR